MIKRLSTDFPEGIANPALQWHYAVLQQLAVGVEYSENTLPVDMTVPDLEGMSRPEVAEVLKAFTCEFPACYSAETVAGVTAWDPKAKKARIDITHIDCKGSLFIR